ncbi:ANTAR domain-containing response regulator [uncultured Dialister sp.]|jgi:AmiR/NasT family two-component response regulator|uniref:ANTAR domain-containing response regulator n=1 Tax=uncultured Dialister sp. TaxID=278064 RepID=UPI0025DE054F|nr:response regulator [uncultured Dialister sp.]
MAEKYKIVIADDEALICMDLREMLEEAGHEVVGIGSDGVEALNLVKEKKPDLAILDVKMPRLDGIQAARMIAHDNLAPVVLLTAFGDEDMIEKAKKSMVFGYVMKPVEEKTLFPAIQIAVSQYRQKKDMVDRVKNMERELAARKIVDRAKGLLMDYYHITEEDAYRRMQQTSMKRGITIADVAQKVVKEIMARKNR